MIRKEYPGAWYADSLPSGEFAVLFDRSHLQTHQGTIPLPAIGDQPLYHRITNIGGFQIAGQGITPVTWWWSEAHGWVRERNAVGVSPVIFDALGNLQIVTAELEPSIGSQGYRYVDAYKRLISGDDTYGPITPFAQSLGVRGLAEWTELSDDLFIGQSATDDQDNAWILQLVRDDEGNIVNAIHRLLEPGPCRFIRATRSGDNISVAIWKPQVGAVLYWLTVAELRALPVVKRVDSSAQVPTIPSTPPTPEPIPVPEQELLKAPNLSALVKRVFAEHPEVHAAVDQDDVRGVMVDWFCHEANKGADRPWGRKARNKDGSRKNGDSAVYLRADGRIEIYDIIANGKPSWQKPTKSLASGENGYWAPANPVSAEPQPVPDKQPAPSDDLAALRNEVAALSVKLAQLEARVTGAEDDERALDKRVAALEQKHAPTYKVTGSTSRDFAHSHKINVTLEPQA